VQPRRRTGLAEIHDNDPSRNAIGEPKGIGTLLITAPETSFGDLVIGNWDLIGIWILGHWVRDTFGGQ